MFEKQGHDFKKQGLIYTALFTRIYTGREHKYKQ